jgi:hypothetical protein
MSAFLTATFYMFWGFLLGVAATVLIALRHSCPVDIEE